MATTNRPWPKRWPDFLGKWPRLTGRQQPEVEVWHEGDESEGDRTAKFGVRIGIRLMPWEWMLVRAAQSMLPANEWGVRLWTHRIVVWEVTRQQGKTLMLILIITRRLFKHRRRVVYTAQQWATVEDVFDRLVAIVERVPSLRRRVASMSKKDNRGVILLKPLPGDKHIVKADFGPRTQHFARGFTEVDDLFADEAYDLVPKEIANLTGAQSASDNPQTFYVSTPPVASEHPNCGRFAGFVRAILAGGAPGLYGALYRAPKTFKRGDPAAYPLAQPSYGVVGDDREMEAHLQGAKDAGPIDLALFDADWLGWGDYPPPPSASKSVISAQTWTDMDMAKRPDSRVTGPTSLAIEQSPDGATWVLVAGQRTTDARVHLEVGYSKSAATADVVAAVVAFVNECDPVAVVVRNGSGAAELIPALDAAKIEVTAVSRPVAAQACGGFLRAATNAGLSNKASVAGQEALTAGVSAAVKRDLPGGAFIWELVDEASFAQLMGASLAHWAIVSFGVDEGPPPKPAVGRKAAPAGVVRDEIDQWASPDADFDPMTASF